MVSCGLSQTEQTNAALGGFLVCLATYIAGALDYFPLAYAAIVTFVISFLQSRQQQFEFIYWFKEKLRLENMRPKQLVYPIMILLVLVDNWESTHADSLMQECDYTFDGFCLMVICLLWVT